MPYKDKEVAKTKKREYYLANKDSLLASSKKKYQDNKDEIIKRCKEYHENNKEIINEKRRERFRINREKEYERQKKWNKRNEDKLKKIKKKYKDTHKKESWIYNKEHRILFKNHYNSYRKKWRSLNKDKMKNEKLKKYGLTIISFNNLLQNQNNQCGICEKEFEDSYPLYPCVDHDHKTDIVRGILCFNCNSGLGGFYDNVENLINTLEWIKIKNKVYTIENVPILLEFSRRKKYGLKKDHGLTIEQFNSLLFEQAGKCGICSKIFTQKRPLNPQVDHNHRTGNIRGLLCRRCNMAIGLLQDDPYIINNALKWLKKEEIHA